MGEHWPKPRQVNINGGFGWYSQYHLGFPGVFYCKEEADAMEAVVDAAGELAADLGHMDKIYHLQMAVEALDAGRKGRKV